MAGIGFTLERMARGGSLTSVVGAYGHAVMVVAGPWIFTLIGLAGTSFVACDAGCRDVQVFRSIIIYNSVFALIASSPIVFVSTRFIADRIFMKRFEIRHVHACGKPWKSISLSPSFSRRPSMDWRRH